MRMLEIFSSEKTYLPAIPDANYVASLLEQILHYMVQKGESIGEVIEFDSVKLQIMTQGRKHIYLRKFSSFSWS